MSDTPNVGRRFRVMLMTDNPGRGYDFVLLPIDPMQPAVPIQMSHSNALHLADDIKELHVMEYESRTNQQKANGATDKRAIRDQRRQPS